jgi:murein L,D-transpeptidase YcbB/YkuD
MKKTILTSILIVNALYSDVEIVEPIPLTSHDIEMLSKNKPTVVFDDSLGSEVHEDSARSDQPPIEGVIVDEQENDRANPVVEPAQNAQNQQWVNNMASNGTVITIKSYLKGMLNGLQYNGEGIENLKSKSLVKRFYRTLDYSTFWISTDYAINPNIFTMIDAIKRAPSEGLDSQKYHLQELDSILSIIKDSPDLDENIRNINIAKLDIYLSDAFLTMAKDLYEGEIDMRRFKEILNKKAKEDDIHYSWDLPLKSNNYISILKSVQDSSDFQSRLFGLSNSNNMLDTLKTAYARYNDIKLQGGWPSIPRGRTLRVGSVDKKRVPLLAKRLYMSGDFDTPNFVGSKMTKELSEALKHFQRRVGKWDSGRLDERTRRLLNIPVEDRLMSIALNISRLRADRENFGDEYIIVNIPDFRMNFVRDNQNILGMRVVVGRRKNPTPIFSASMKYFEINPYWTVPDSIVKKEMLHRIQEDPDYLSSRRFKMYKTWKNGAKPVDAFDVDWWKYTDDSNLPYRFVKDPGKGNPLGFVKFMFPNSHAVYMHDTNEKKFFKSPVRAYSHGCIRLQKPQELLDYLTQNYTSLSSDFIEKVKKEKKNRSFRLDRSIPVHIRYWTAWVNDDGGVSFRNDIYGYDKIQKELMNR